MKKLSTWAMNVSPSPTLAVDAKAKQLKAQGEDVCGFGTGEPDFDTPSFIKEACKKALDEGKTKYLPAAGLPQLRAALAEKYRNENGIAGAQDINTVVSPGGKFSCYLAILATCSPGDEVIIPSPYWVSYPEMVKLAGASPVIIQTDDKTNFKISPEQIKDAITPKTRLLIFNSPSNPTGTVYTKKEIESIIEVALSAGIYVLSDEIYEYLLYDNAEHFSPASLNSEAAEAVITVSGFSKTFSMTGWRLGTLVAHEKIAKAVANIQSQTTSNATTFAQYGALAALQNKDKATQAINEMKTVFDKRRTKLHDGLNSIEGIYCLKAQGAFYLFPNINSFGKTSLDFAADLLEKEKVAVVPGFAFGAEGYLRLSYATSEDVIEKGIDRLKRFCQTL